MTEVTQHNLMPFDYIEVPVSFYKGQLKKVAIRFSIDRVENGAVTVTLMNNLDQVIADVINMTQQGLLRAT